MLKRDDTLNRCPNSPDKVRLPDDCRVIRDSTMPFMRLKTSFSKELLPIIAQILCVALPAHSQDKLPEGEIFGGYSFSSSIQNHPETVLTNGWGVDFVGRLYKRLGIVAALGGQYGHANFGTTAFVEHDFLFGGRLGWGDGKLNAFVDGLAGIAHYNAYDLPYKTFYLHYPADTSFAMAFGGGVDVKVGRKVAIRVVKLDFMPVRTRPYWTRNIRVQSGIVLRFGS